MLEAITIIVIFALGVALGALLLDLKRRHPNTAADQLSLLAIIELYTKGIDHCVIIHDQDEKILYLNDQAKELADKYGLTDHTQAASFFSAFHKDCKEEEQLQHSYDFLKSSPDLIHREEIRTLDNQRLLRNTRILHACDDSFIRCWSIKNLTNDIGDDADAQFLSEQMSEQAIQNAYLAEELFAAREEMERLAHTDPLTGLMNRRAFMQKGLEMINHQTETKRLFVAMLDIDHFKKVNDTYGHAAGDECIIAVATMISQQVDDNGICCRMGGEEFAIAYLSDTIDSLHQCTENIRVALEAHKVIFEGQTIQITSSFGLASFRPEDSTLDAVLDRADKALYKAKQNGRNQICYFNEE